MSISIYEFGRDHWSLFAYVETRVVDHGGTIDKRHLRCIHVRHPHQAHRGGDASAYATRLRGDRKLENHDDWDCLDDLEAAGLVEAVGTGLYPAYLLTDFGREVAGKLRAHKGRGGQFREFFYGALNEERLPSWLGQS